jgi:hypothetical protein
MGAVLTKDVGKYEIWAGNPARLIRKRFEDNYIEVLDRSSWWDLDEALLREKAKAFHNAIDFINELENNELENNE